MADPFICPFCNMVSHSPKDAEQRYCGNCHLFLDDVLAASPAVRRAMSRFYRKLAEKITDRVRAEELERTAKAWETGLT